MFEDYENIMAKEKFERDDMEKMIMDICNPWNFLQKAKETQETEEDEEDTYED